jgi:drug/metabolite transporter (DMT)-like permease
MSSNHSTGLAPVFSLLLGASLWGVIWYPLRLLEAQGMQGYWLALLLYGAALLAALPRTARHLVEAARHPGSLLLLLVAAGWTNVAFFQAMLEGNVLRVLLLFYLSPLWTVILGRWVLGERMSLGALVSLLLAMIGALIMLWDVRIGLPWPGSRADWLALSSGFAFAVSNVVVRKLQDISLECKSMAVWGGVVVVAGALIVVMGIPLPRVSGATYGGAAVLGVFGILIMTLLVQFGVTHLPVHRSAVIALVEVVVGAVSQRWLTDEVVMATDWWGGVMIVLGAYLSAQASSPRRGQPMAPV